MDEEDGITPSTPKLEEPQPSRSCFKTIDPWLPVSSSAGEEGVSSTSPTRLQHQYQHLHDPSTAFNSSDVHQWLENSSSTNNTTTTSTGGGGGDSGFGQDQEFGQQEEGQGDPFLVCGGSSNMSPPATSTTATGGGGGSGDNNGGDGAASSSKCQKDEIIPCNHSKAAQSLAGVRKATKGDIRIVCSKDHCEAISAKQWMCLQCGHIGCGDGGAQGGHAKLHFKTPRSDCHSVAVQMNGNLDKAWCFDCQAEVDPNATCFKDCIQLLRRSQKVKAAMAQSLSGGGGRSLNPPIALGPPPPPPVPKIEPQKQFSAKGNKQGNNNNNRMNSASSSNNSYNNSNRWDRDSGGIEWPLGLDNLGNTCFMNSALQCLSRTRSLLDKLEVHGSGNLIEILVSPEDPCVQLVNPSVDESITNNVDENDNDGSSPSSEFSSDFERRSLLIHNYHGGVDSSSSQQSTSADSSEGGSGEISPSSTEIDSLLDAASSRSSRKSESEGCGDAEKQLWKKELEQELAKPLRLRLGIPKDSMTTKLRHCFRAVTRCSDGSTDNEGGSSGSRNMYSRPVYSPRGIQLAVSKHFRLGHQHDSHELLRSVVDMMKKDQIRSFRLAIMQRYGVKRNEGKNCDPKLTELLKMWDRKLYHKTFVDEIFGGELVTFQECLQCHNVRRSHEEFLDLSLPIRVFRANANQNTRKTYSLFDDDHDYVINRSVEECLRAYTEPEFLTGSNVVECEKCHRMNLEKLANGSSFDEVFPHVKLEPNNTNQSSNSGGKGMSKHQQKKQKCKRQNRQAKMKSKQQIQVDCEEESPLVENSEHANTTNDGLNLVEDHFRNDQQQSLSSSKSTQDQQKSNGLLPEDDSKSNKSGSLDDYVVVQNASTINQQGRQHKEKNNVVVVDQHVDMDYDNTPSEIDGEIICHSSAQQQEQLEQEEVEFNLTRGLSSSIKSLTLIENGMDVEEGGGVDPLLLPEDENMDHHHHNNENFDEDMDDLDDLAVDGIGNASDIEDDEDDNNGHAIRLDLGLEDKPISVAEYLTVPTTGGGSGGTADEGFSEGENSSEEKPSQSLSGRSSSHNSISETDNNIIIGGGVGGGELIGEASGGGGDNKPVKKIPITKCPCTRRQLISRAPECLTLHLKRFQHTARGSSKLGDKVSFPYILNLTDSCSEVVEDVNRPGFKTTFDEDGQVVYSLYGIVEHSGSLHFGHYVAYVKVAGKPITTTITTTSEEEVVDADENFEGSSSSNTKTSTIGEDAWFYISDSHVSRTTLKQVLVQDAYILFYERIRGPEKRERLEALRSIEIERRDSWSGNNNKGQYHHQGSSSVTYSYNNKPVPSTAATVVTTYSDSTSTNWNENWENSPSSTSHQVSSTNNEDMSMTLNYESSDPVSSSTLYSSSSSSTVTTQLLGGVDGVSSTTLDADSMDYHHSAPTLGVGPSSSSHPLWNDEDIRGGSAFFGDIMEDNNDVEETLNNTSNPVSSSSDVIINNPRSDGYAPLEEVD